MTSRPALPRTFPASAAAIVTLRPPHSGDPASEYGEPGAGGEASEGTGHSAVLPVNRDTTPVSSEAT